MPGGKLRRHQVTALRALVPTMLDALADAATARTTSSPWLRMGLVDCRGLISLCGWVEVT